MPPTLRSTHHRWCDVDGAHIALFSWVEQVMTDPEAGVLPSRLHQRGQVLGRGIHSLYVRFSDNFQVSLPSRLMRLLPDAPRECDAPQHRARECPCARNHPYWATVMRAISA
jgi:hypothetical protein